MGEAMCSEQVCEGMHYAGSLGEAFGVLLEDMAGNHLPGRHHRIGAHRYTLFRTVCCAHGWCLWVPQTAVLCQVLLSHVFASYRGGKPDQSLHWLTSCEGKPLAA